MTTRSIEVKRPGRAPGEARPSPTRWSYRPAVDVLETEDEVIIRVDLPGAKAENVEIDFEDDRLAVHARVHAPTRLEGRREIVHEYGIGDYDREFSIAMPIEVERIRAEFSLGTLAIHLPKPERLKPRRIPVKGS